MKGTLDGKMFTMALIYTSNSGQLQFFDGTLKDLNSFKEGSLLIGSDLNYVSDLSLDKFGKTNKSKNYRRTKTHF